MDILKKRTMLNSSSTPGSSTRNDATGQVYTDTSLHIVYVNISVFIADVDIHTGWNMYRIIDLHLVSGRNDGTGNILEIGKEVTVVISEIGIGDNIITGIGKFKVYVPDDLLQFGIAAGFNIQINFNMNGIFSPRNDMHRTVFV